MRSGMIKSTESAMNRRRDHLTPLWPAVCTIISRNYLSSARVLAESVLRHHSGAHFYLLVIDDLPPDVDAGPGIRLINLKELDLPYMDELPFKYDITELCTAVKPTFLRLLINGYGEEDVVYLDPDILVMRPLAEISACLSSANIVLTPHLLHPIPLDGMKPSEQDILLSGAYNLGFIAVRKSDSSAEFLAWWEYRLRDGCLMDHQNGMMTDQRWIDLIPGLFPVSILKDETYNVAYWNIHSRRLERNGNLFSVNGRPLAFFHFSGFNPARRRVFSKHQNRTRIQEGTPLTDILDLYADAQMRHGLETCGRWTYGYGAFDNGVPIHPLLRRIYSDLESYQQTSFGDPFRSTGRNSFLEWATRTDPTTSMSPFLMKVYESRPDVIRAFPDVHHTDREAFLAWACTSGADEMDYDPVAMRIRTTGPYTSDGTDTPAEFRVKCSIIIPVHNKASLTSACIDAVLAHVPSTFTFETIVIDDASTDGTRQLLSSYGDRIRVMHHDLNKGFAVSCNDGATVAAGEYLVFLNNDTVAQDGWLQALVGYAAAHPEAAIVGSKLLFPNDTIQHAGFAICEDGEPRHLYTGFPSDHPAVNRSRRLQAVTGACFLIRRSDFDRAGGFDTTFRNGYEDVDLCLRVGELDREIHYCHESVLYHLESISRDESRSRNDRHNNDIYRKRWLRRVRPDELSRYVEDGLLEIEYTPFYPMTFSISPLLATMAGSRSKNGIDRLLQSRSRQVLGLLKDNIRLNVRVQEVEAREGRRDSQKSATASQPQLLARGECQWHSAETSGRVVSIILPVKNGAAKLRQLLPAIQSQRCIDAVEIVAVDSGSTDGSVELLLEARATVISIDPRTFNHGLTRNLAASYASGSILVFLNQSTLPADEFWLANLIAPFSRDSRLAGVCGRVLPREDADLLVARDIGRNINASTNRLVTEFSDPESLRSLTTEKFRALINFHTLSAAIRADVFRRIPFADADFAEDLIWGKDALEAGFQIQFEPSSVAYHSHNYTLLDILRRNFDDGVAGRRIVGRDLGDLEVEPAILHLIRDDWRYLESQRGLQLHELEQWRLAAASRRAAQVIGQWLGIRYGSSIDLPSLLSLTEQIRSGATTETPEIRSAACV